MMRAVHSSTVLYPCDANQTAKLVAAMASLEGIGYIRTTRGNTPVRYGPDEEFPIGGSCVLRSSDDDEVTIVGAGITVVEALAAADALADEGIQARVIDCYSVKPIDAEGLREAAAATGAVVTVEDHWPEGGLGEAVLAALAELDEHPRVAVLGVEGMPGSGKPAELLAAAGIDREHVADAARRLVRTRALG
jgi:transketolase